MFLIEHLIEELRPYVLLDREPPIDLIARLAATGLIFEDLRHSLLIEHMKDI